MKIVSKTFKAECAEPITLDIIENYFKEISVMPVRWAITEISEKNFMKNISISAAVIED